ncbi:MAG TPA: AI-2E family transporter [Pseudolabrys sp.]|nr:AI-2E family transporter [Pseudolabrys sp.]
MARDPRQQASRDQATVAFIEIAIRLVALALLLYWALILIRPFISIVIWSVVLTVALYPIYEWMSRWLGGYRRLAALLITVLSLLVVIGPATWLALGLVDSLRVISERLDFSTLTIPPPSLTVKNWPLIGEPIYQFWDLASTNSRAALAKIIPQLKPLGTSLLRIGADTGLGIIKFLASIIVAGFLFLQAPALVDAVKKFSRRLSSERGEEFVNQAGATIRAVSRGVIGISVLQALLAGIGLMVAGIPQASLITFGVLVFGIIQIGPSIILIPVIIWVWMTMETTSALLFTAYMAPVNLLDNILRPLVMGRGLKTPMLVILIGVIGGTLAYGITGLFLGPIVLAVVWELFVVWIGDNETPLLGGPGPRKVTTPRGQALEEEDRPGRLRPPRSEQ